MTLLDSNLAYYSAIGVVFVNFVLFLVATVTNWQCYNGNALGIPFDMCTKLYDDMYQDSDLFSEYEKNDVHGYRAALAFAILSTLAAFVQLVFIFAKLCCSKKKDSSDCRKLAYYIVAVFGTIFSLLQWSIFIGLIRTDKGSRGQMDLGAGFYLSIVGMIFSLYPLVYATAVWRKMEGLESLGAKETPTWKYSAVRRSAIAP